MVDTAATVDMAGDIIVTADMGITTAKNPLCSKFVKGPIPLDPPYWEFEFCTPLMINMMSVPLQYSHNMVLIINT